MDSVEAAAPPHIRQWISQRLSPPRACHADRPQHGVGAGPEPAVHAGLEMLRIARQDALAWRQEEEAKWRVRQSAEFPDRVAAEHERLTRVLVGSEGLDPAAWKRLPRKLELVARRNVQRQDMLEKHRLEHFEWDVRAKAAENVRKMRALNSNAQVDSPAAAAVAASIADPLSTLGTQGASEPRLVSRKARTMESMRVELAASICNRMRAMGVHGGTVLPDDQWLHDLEAEEEEEEEEEQGAAGNGGGVNPGQEHRHLARQDTDFESEFIQGLARDMQVHLSKSKRPRHLSAQVSRVSATSTQAAASMALRLHQQQYAAQQLEDAAGEGEGDTTEDDRASVANRRTSVAGSCKSAVSFSGLSKIVSKVMGGSGRPMTAGSSMRAMGNSSTAARRSALARAARKAVVSPIVQSYQDACSARGVYVSPEVSTQLSLSETSRELKLVGVALPDAVAASIADVIFKTQHLTAVSFSQTVLNPGALAALLPACWSRRLRDVQLTTTDMTPECWPHLLSALRRPTHTLNTQHPPSEWWLTLRSLSLSGNPLGDQGMAVLSPALRELQALTHLDLSQAGITDWSAPVLEGLLRESSHQLQSLSLAHNQLGPLSGRALAGVLPTHPHLTHLDLSWNPLGGGGVALLAWGLLSPRAGRQSKLSSLSLCGVDMESEDHLALAALLKWGHAWLPLRDLEISHNNLVGVSAQILMRQLDALLPAPAARPATVPYDTGQPSAPAGQQPQPTDPVVPKLDLKKTLSQALESSRKLARASLTSMGTGTQRSLGTEEGWEAQSGTHTGRGLSEASTLNTARKVQQRLTAGLRTRQSQSLPAGSSSTGAAAAVGVYSARGTPSTTGVAAARGGVAGTHRPGGSAGGSRDMSSGSPGIRILAMGCQVDVDGGQAPTPRVRLDGSDVTSAKDKSGLSDGISKPITKAPTTSQQKTATSILQATLDDILGPGDSQQRRAQMRNCQQGAGTGRVVNGRPVQHFELRLDTARPDHYIAQLLVEHELDARRHHCTAWQNVQLDDTVYRCNGQDVKPFDVLYEGWAHPGVLPNEGVLILDVSPLPQHASKWLLNPRLHFNAARLLQQ